MNDLISRKDAVELLKNDMENNGLPLYDDYNIGINHAMCLLACVPTAEPKVGKWIDGEREGYNGTYCYRYCSECLFERNDDDADKDTPYCPNCGAKMEAEE